jgi:excisionase family DNA binding protein
MSTPILEYVSQTCARYNIARSYLYRLIGEGKIEAVKDGSRTKIIVASADAHFASLPKAKIKPPKRAPAAVTSAPSEGGVMVVAPMAVSDAARTEAST